MDFAIVAAGGAVGAAGRYAISLIPIKSEFPVPTFFANFLGAIAIGLIVGLADRYGIPARLTLFLKTGVCGGFTTFSTFSLEACNLFERGSYGFAILYIFSSVVGCVGGVWCAKKMTTIGQ